MWDQGDEMNQGGGYLNSPSQFQTPSGADKPKTEDSTIGHYNIKEVISRGDQITGSSNNIIIIVGIVREIEKSSIKITYTIEDDTGTIKAVSWLEENSESESANVNIVENTYCRIVGLGRNIENQNGLIIFKIVPLDSYEEVVFHILKTWHNKLSETMAKDEPMETNFSTNSHQAEENHNSMGFGPSKSKVLKILTDQAGAQGMHVDKIMAALNNSISKSELMNIINFFVDEGHVYSTIDSNHFIAMK